jgi:hypothetical protein
MSTWQWLLGAATWSLLVFRLGCITGEYHEHKHHAWRDRFRDQQYAHLAKVAVELRLEVERLTREAR